MNTMMKMFGAVQMFKNTRIMSWFLMCCVAVYAKSSHFLHDSSDVQFAAWITNVIPDDREK